MQGIIFAELKKLVDTRFGGDTWKKLQNESGIGERIYLAMAEYPDSEALALVSAASKATGRPVPALLEEFGEFIVPDLVTMYQAIIRPEWKLLDFIMHTEESIHRIVRAKNPGAKPPELKCSRPHPNEVVIVYRSARKMCGVAKGILRGFSKHYGEEILLAETSCMLKGNPSCQISVKIKG